MDSTNIEDDSKGLTMPSIRLDLSITITKEEKLQVIIRHPDSGKILASGQFFIEEYLVHLRDYLNQEIPSIWKLVPVIFFIDEMMGFLTYREFFVQTQ